ncbi:hypothetical protein L7F22_023939 [Adiantum nelumboides]|nr:hypothetical protein [Adiantum nelumboides]
MEQIDVEDAAARGLLVGVMLSSVQGGACGRGSSLGGLDRRWRSGGGSHIPLFKTLFPPFQGYITKGFVSEEELGKRLAQVVSNPSLSKSGVYWSWNNDFSSSENIMSKEASNQDKAKKVWEVTEKVVGLA